MVYQNLYRCYMLLVLNYFTNWYKELTLSTHTHTRARAHVLYINNLANIVSPAIMRESEINPILIYVVCVSFFLFLKCIMCKHWFAFLVRTKTVCDRKENTLSYVRISPSSRFARFVKNHVIGSYDLHDHQIGLFVTRKCVKPMMPVPDRVWSINDLTEEELRDLHFELDYEHKEERWWEQEPLKILDLSSNSLTAIDGKIRFLSELNTLDLHSNLLEELPAEIGSLNKLKTLDASDNKLESLPPELYTLEELWELHLKGNHIGVLEPEIGNLIMLIHLDLSHNDLNELPVGLGYLVRLKTLNLSDNAIKELPPDMTSMRSLRTLDASSNELEILPPLGELRKVERIMLQSNNLRDFPDISGCSALTVLHLDNNNIPEILPQCLEGVGHLKRLTLQNNKIEVIPEEIVKLINLEVLDLSHNIVSIVPTCIGILPHLKQFVIKGNDIKNIRGDIIRCGTPRILTHIRHITDNASARARELLQGGDDVNNYPDKYMMKSTKLMSVTGQGLAELPENVLKDALEAAVTTIDLSRNKFTELPDEMSMVVTVTDMKLTSNHLTCLPEWIGEKYKYLQALDISRNYLQTLPLSCGCLKYLRDIDLSFNRFTELPEAIYEIESLEGLLVNDNLIAEINVPSLKKLKRLAILNLANNNISHVPPELGNLKNLRNLSLAGNCFKYPRQAILAKDTEEILSYLRNLIPR